VPRKRDDAFEIDRGTITEFNRNERLVNAGQLRMHAVALAVDGS
jgi:hypothetical protein